MRNCIHAGVCSASSCRPLLLFVFLFFLLELAESGDHCSARRSSCGHLSVSDPFRLSSDPLGCGKIELTCRGTNASIHIGQTEYFVTDIQYNNVKVDVWWHSVVVSLVYADFATAGRLPIIPGSLYDHSWPAGNGTWFFINDICVSVINCSQKINSSSSTRDGGVYVPLPSSSSDLATLYAMSDDDAYSCGRISDLHQSCSFVGYWLFADNKAWNIIRTEEDVLLAARNGLVATWRLDWESNFMKCFTTWWWRGVAFATESRIFKAIATIFFPVVIEMGILECGYELYCSYGFHTFCKGNSQLAAYQTRMVLVLLLAAIYMKYIVAHLAVYIFIAHKFWKSKRQVDLVEKFLRLQQTMSPARYAYSDLIAMTNNFGEKLGQGGFGSVYKGHLHGVLPVAVKLLGSSKLNGEEFISEVSTIGRIHHVNVVKLLGFCSDGSKRALIYEYLPNGSLDKYIFPSKSAAGGRNVLTLDKLSEIALGVARGIDYLHRGCDMQILHFDIKPHNILLDGNFVPKVSDFGLAKLYPKDRSLVSASAVRGTIGYIAPEWVSRSFGPVSYKSDVYSYGMLLLEMAGQRRNVDHGVSRSSKVYYPSWIYGKLAELQEEKITSSVPDITLDIDEVEAKLCKIGLWCIQMKPSNRPSMTKVVEMLEGNSSGDEIEMPPKPFFSSSDSTSLAHQSNMQLGSSIELSIISESNELPLLFN